MAEAAGVAMPGLRRAWLREMGLEHLWVSPGGAIRIGQAGAAVPAARTDAPTDAPGAALPEGSSPEPGHEALAQAGDEGGTPASFEPAAAAATAAPAPAPEHRDAPAGPREPSVAAYGQPGDAVSDDPAVDATSFQPEPEPGTPAQQRAPASAEPRAEPSAGAGAQAASTGWMAWDVPPASDGAPAWMVLAKAEDAGAPAAQALLQAMLSAVGRRVVPLAPGQRGDASARPAALIAVGPAARAALGCAAQPWMQVGEGRWKGEPVAVLTLPPMADIGAGAEAKAPAWRALLRLGAAG